MHTVINSNKYFASEECVRDAIKASAECPDDTVWIRVHSGVASHYRRILLERAESRDGDAYSGLTQDPHPDAERRQLAPWTVRIEVYRRTY